VHVYVDESKSKGYVLAAVFVEPGNSRRIRKQLTQLRLAGQTYIHFANERDSRRKLILSKLESLEIRARIYFVPVSNTYEARAACLLRLITDVDAQGASRLVLELDESVKRRDELLIVGELRRRRARERVDFEALPKAAEPILWCADAIVWSYNRGGDFRRRALRLIDSVTRIGT
jgi:hypothetical protein